MGIERHLARHKSEPGRIHDITIESEQTRCHFDPKRDLTPADWEGMQGRIENLRANRKWWPYFQGALDMRILNPSWSPRLTSSEFEDAREALKSKRLGEGDRVPMVYPFPLLIGLRRFDRSAVTGLTPAEWTYLNDELRGDRLRASWEAFSATAAQMKQLDPSQPKTLTEADWEGMMAAPRALRERSLFGFVAHAARMRILDDTRDLGITEHDWIAMRNVLARLREEKDWGNAAGISAAMTILSAQKVDAREDDLYLTMPQDFTRVTPPRPARKG